MQLYAVREKSDTTARRIEVYDDNGRTFIRKTMPNGNIIEWHNDHTAAEWVAMNNSRPNKTNPAWRKESPQCQTI